MEAPESQIVIEQIPNVKSLFAFALEIPEYPHNNAGYYYAATLKLHHVLIQLEREIEALGYWAASAVDRKRIISCWSSDTEGKLTHLEWDVQKLAAQTSLGKINADGLFETPEFGVRNIIGVLATDADLSPLSRNQWHLHHSKIQKAHREEPAQSPASDCRCQFGHPFRRRQE